MLRNARVDCETIHKRMRGDEKSQVKIDDPDIVRYLMDERKKGNVITLICNDTDLAGHCKVQNLPVLFVPDLVLDAIKKIEAPR